MRPVAVFLFALFFLSCVAAAPGAENYVAPDISIPVGAGQIVITGARFLDAVSPGVVAPTLSFVLVNKSGGPLNSIKLRFDMGGFCEGQPARWSDEISTSAGWSADRDVSRAISDTIIPLIGKVDLCEAVLIRAAVVSADNLSTTQPSDTDTMLDALGAIKAADDATAAERKRLERERSAEKAAQDLARRRLDEADVQKAMRRPKDSIVALVDSLALGGGESAKGEFETSAHYATRESTLLKAHDSVYTFVKDAADSDFSYDADSGAMHVKLVPTGRALRDGGRSAVLTMKTNLVARSSYLGTNAFGVKKTIVSSKYSVYEIAVSEDSRFKFEGIKIGDYQTGFFEPLERDVSMTADRARDLKPYLRFAIYGRLADSHVFLESDSTTATIDSPYESTTKHRILMFRVESIKIIDVRSGSIVSDIMGAAGDGANEPKD